MAGIGLRDKLIEAGIEEINARGLQNFSVRRIAARCGVSCAAPYKHFADKQSYIAAIISYINGVWDERQRQASARRTATRERLVEICREYISFLVENPQFRVIIMQKDSEGGGEFNALRGQLSRQTYLLVSRYCAEVGMPDEVRVRKTYVVRSLIYGAALMLDNGELPYTPEHLDMAAAVINREFDLG
jgi:Transcriptional regulator